MFLTVIPNNASHILIDTDSRVFVVSSNIRSTSAIELGIAIDMLSPSIIQLPAMIANRSRYLSSDCKIVTSTGKLYQEMILEKLLTKSNIKYRSEIESGSQLCSDLDEIPF